jgi:hypothetical protein
MLLEGETCPIGKQMPRDLYSISVVIHVQNDMDPSSNICGTVSSAYEHAPWWVLCTSEHVTSHCWQTLCKGARKIRLILRLYHISLTNVHSAWAPGSI